MNQLTDKQKKAIAIGIAFLAFAHFFLPGIVTTMRRAFAGDAPALVQKPSPVQAAHVPSPAPPPSPEEIAAGKYGGIWVGNALMPNQYRCNIRVESRLGDEIPKQLKGYESKSCVPLQPFAGGKPTKDSIADVMRLTAPVSSVMTGTPQPGGVRFTVDQTIGTPADGCVLSSLTMTDFGLGQVQAEWKEDHSCNGGNMVLRRARG